MKMQEYLSLVLSNSLKRDIPVSTFKTFLIILQKENVRFPEISLLCYEIPAAF